MPYPFQPPNLQPIQYPDPQASLDNIFNNVMRQQIQSKQLQAQQLQIDNQKQEMAMRQSQNMLAGAPYGLDFSQPQEIKQGLQEYNNSQAPQGFQGAPNPQESQMTHFGRGVKAYIEQQQAMASLGLGEKKADIYAKVGEGMNKMFLPQLAGMQPPNIGGISSLMPQSGGQSQGPNLVESEAQNVASGRKAPSQVTGRGTDPMLSAAIKDRVNKINPKFDWEGAESKFKGLQEAATTAESATIKMPIYRARATLPLLDDLNTLAGSVGGHSWQAINKAGIAMAAQGGDRGANQLQTQAGMISDEIQSMFGSGSDKKLDLAVGLLSTAKTKNQLQDSIAIVRSAVRNRINALSNQPLEQGPAQSIGIQMTPDDIHNEMKLRGLK